MLLAFNAGQVHLVVTRGFINGLRDIVVQQLNLVFTPKMFDAVPQTGDREDLYVFHQRGLVGVGSGNEYGGITLVSRNRHHGQNALGVAYPLQRKFTQEYRSSRHEIDLPEAKQRANRDG